MWIEILKTGTFTDSKGRTHTFSDDDLERIVQMYNSQVEKNPSYEAPLVKGHPEDNSPAYGWVERLARRGQFLYAKLKSLSKEILEDIKEGRFRRVSISLYPNLLLRHVGLLGGSTPAVDGLRPLAFIDSDEALLIEYQSDAIDFAELRKEIQRLEHMNSQLSRQNETLRNQLLALHNESLSHSFRNFIQQLNSASDYIIVPPNKEETLLELMHYCSKADEYFKTNKIELFPQNFSFLERLQQVLLELKPLPIKQEFSRARSEDYSYDNLFEGKNVDQERLALHLRAKQIQKEKPNLSYEEALILTKNS
ncbi:MAG: hypothetical protein ACK4SO_01170 [Candidatus Kapaibacteriota bacterium]